MAPFTMMDIKLLCGVTAFKRGEAYNQSGRVSNLVVSDDHRHYEAMVRGTERYQVKVDLDEKGKLRQIALVQAMASIMTIASMSQRFCWRFMNGVSSRSLMLPVPVLCRNHPNLPQGILLALVQALLPG